MTFIAHSPLCARSIQLPMSHPRNRKFLREAAWSQRRSVSQVPHAVAEAAAAPLESGRRAKLGARHIGSVAAQGGEPRAGIAHARASVRHRPASRSQDAGRRADAICRRGFRQTVRRSGGACDGVSCARGRGRRSEFRRTTGRAVAPARTSTASWQITRRLASLACSACSSKRPTPGRCTSIPR